MNPTTCSTPVTVVGEACVHVLADGLPRHDVHLGQVEIGLGGPAAVVAAQLGLLGVASRLIATVGDDLLGDLLLAELRAAGVDSSLVVRRGRTGRVVIGLVDGEVRLAADTVGAAAVVSPADLPEMPRPDTGLVYVTAFPALLPVVSSLGEAGHRLVVDVGFIPLLGDPAALLEHIGQVARWCDTVVVSGASLDPSTRAAAVAVAREGGADHVLVTRAADGVEIHDAASSSRLLAAEPVVAVDPLCAGDAFVAGYLAGRAGGADVVASAELGGRVAAAKVSRFARLPRLDELGLERSA